MTDDSSYPPGMILSADETTTCSAPAEESDYAKSIRLLRLVRKARMTGYDGDNDDSD